MLMMEIMGMDMVRVKHDGDVVHDHEDDGRWHMMDEEVEDGWEAYGVLRREKKKDNKSINTNSEHEDYEAYMNKQSNINELCT